MDNFMGCGTRFLNWHHYDDHSSVATRWVTMFFLPLMPVSRHRLIVYTDPSDSGNTQVGGLPGVVTTFQMNDRFQILENLPIVRGEVMRTWLFAYVVMPVVLVLPVAILLPWSWNTDLDSMWQVLVVMVGWMFYGLLYFPGFLAHQLHKTRGAGAFQDTVKERSSFPPLEHPAFRPQGDVPTLRPVHEFTRPSSFHWEVIQTAGSGPGPRSRHCLEYDRQEQATVLFGGALWCYGGRLCGDTWLRRGGRWERIYPARQPPARHRGAMVYDSQRSHCVMFGGCGWKGLMNDTWLFTDRQWQRIRFGRQPSGRCGHVMAFDEAMQRPVMFGGADAQDRTLGDTWLFDGDRWERIESPGPTPRRFAAMAWHPQLKGCVLHGGAADDAGSELFGDTWLFGNGAWTRLPESFVTEGRDDHSQAFHYAAGVLLQIDGASGSGETLKFSCEGWQSAEAPPLTEPRQCAPVVWDESINGLLMHGGEVHHAGMQYAETWVLRFSEKRIAPT